MSRQNNVNPDHYKIAGREHIGDTGSAAAKDSKQAHAVNRGVEQAPERDRKKKPKDGR